MNHEMGVSVKCRNKVVVRNGTPYRDEGRPATVRYAEDLSCNWQVTHSYRGVWELSEHFAASTLQSLAW